VKVLDLLSIFKKAKSLIELHEGKIWAESEMGAGTEIIFELP